VYRRFSYGPLLDVFVRVSFQGLDNARALGEPILGRLRTPPVDGGDLRFVWGGDTAGQGWGINPGFGGMRIYEAMRRRQPQFFIHSGDTIYADGPIPSSQLAEGGRVWSNLVTPEVAKVAETLDEYRGRYRYNLLDDNLRRFNAEVAQIWQWDDHEVSNNWSDAKSVEADPRYTEKNVPLLVARGTRAFLDYAPMRPFDARESQRVYRRFSYGPLLDVFVLDMRSYRGPNSTNRQGTPGEATAFLGERQLRWLKGAWRARARRGRWWRPTCRSACWSATAATRRAATASRRWPTATARCSAASSRSPTCCRTCGARRSRMSCG
jgi:alkaline phosphatase D